MISAVIRSPAATLYCSNFASSHSSAAFLQALMLPRKEKVNPMMIDEINRAQFSHKKISGPFLKDYILILQYGESATLYNMKLTVQIDM
jgi:hypothetical protein